jgi:hypothetical protein
MTGPWKSGLSEGKLNRETENGLRAFLEASKRRFMTRMKETDSKIREVNDSLVTLLGEEGLVKLRDDYENEWLKTLVLGYGDKVVMFETEDKIIRKGEPGYMQPDSKFGRAHFYAPFKMLGNLPVDTYWFNMLVIWLVSAILYVALYYNLLRRLLEYFENLRLPKPEI